MLNFDADLYAETTTRPASPTQTHRVEVPQVQERVQITPLKQDSVSAPHSAATNETAAQRPAMHEWERIRDYVIERIIAIHGPIARDIRAENTIFMGFADRWSGVAMDIARHALEDEGGFWLSAPVGVARFHRTSDPVFARPIAEKLNA